MSEKYKIRDQNKLYFITFAVVYWVDVFTRNMYTDLILESLRYCKRDKGLEIYGWVIMSNHVHLIVGRNGEENIEHIIRDFKKYTSVHICKAIEENRQESRKQWMLKIFSQAAARSNKHIKYKFWQNEYHPIELSTNELMDQKLEYIHNNPVVSGIVDDPVSYLYSSARDYMTDKRGLLKIKFIG